MRSWHEDKYAQTRISGHAQPRRWFYPLHPLSVLNWMSLLWNEKNHRNCSYFLKKQTLLTMYYRSLIIVTIVENINQRCPNIVTFVIIIYHKLMTWEHICILYRFHVLSWLYNKLYFHINHTVICQPSSHINCTIDCTINHTIIQTIPSTIRSYFTITHTII